MKTKTYGRCILCGNNTFLTREHIFADWIGEVIPSTCNSTLSELILPEDYKYSFRDGRPSEDTLEILCHTCNNDWGGRLQRKASECLKPFLLGDKLVLNERDCRVIARWATCFTMVREFLHPQLATIPRLVRKSFVNKSDIPPTGFAIWIGRFNGPSQADYSSWHRALNFLLTAKPTKTANTTLMQFAVGKAVFFVMYTSVLELQEWDNAHHYALLKYLHSLGMQRIFNNTKTLDFSTSHIVDARDYKNLMEHVSKHLDNPLPIIAGLIDA